MTSTHPVDKALCFIEAYLSKGFGLEELDSHAKQTQKELNEYMGYEGEENIE